MSQRVRRVFVQILEDFLRWFVAEVVVKVSGLACRHSDVITADAADFTKDQRDTEAQISDISVQT